MSKKSQSSELTPCFFCIYTRQTEDIIYVTNMAKYSLTVSFSDNL